jgi:hypothetical protein
MENQMLIELTAEIVAAQDTTVAPSATQLFNLAFGAGQEEMGKC